MLKEIAEKRWLLVLPLLAGIGLFFVPLLGDFHFESAMLLSLVGCFWAGIRACGDQQPYGDFYSALALLGYLYLAGIPLLLGALLKGCFSVHGLAFWLVFPLPSVFFGFAVGRLSRIWKLPNRRFFTTAVLLATGIGIFIFEFFHYPQVYFFNHVWGGWAGPIYDETITISAAAVFFRSMTMLWVLLLWHLPHINGEKLSMLIFGLSAISLGFSYTQLAEMGVVSPPSHIQSVLGGRMETEHFRIYYEKDYYSKYRINLLAREHELYLEQVSDKLEMDLPDTHQKIESYLYANPWQKKRLVGAKFTSYVPVWLGQDQLHIAAQQIDGSLRHELVHVAAKQFGNALINASWSIGLIEGLAVAVDGGPSSTTTIDQIVAAQKPYPGPVDLRRSFSPWGFYSGRSGVNYTTSGSFVRFLLDEYPVEYLKKAYGTGNIVDSYPQKSWQLLAERWHQHLDSVAVDSMDMRKAQQIFSIPSLLEKKCPHVASEFAAAWDEYQYFWTTRDTTNALRRIDAALIESGRLPLVKAEWAFRHLQAGKYEEVRQFASLKDTTFELQLLYADAFALAGHPEEATDHIMKAKRIFTGNPDSSKEWALQTRRNPRQWEIHRRLVYEGELPDSARFRKAAYHTKMRAVQASIDQEKWPAMVNYAQLLIKQPIQEAFFDDYLKLIHHLNFQGKTRIAGHWIQELNRLTLRNRYRERLSDEMEWQTFLQ